MSSRRAFLVKTGLVGVSVAVPASMAACNVGVGEPPISSGPRINPDWENRAGQLEDSKGIYTEQDPGEWSGKEGSHVPKVEFDAAAGTVTVFSTHGMAEDHWITTLYVKDQNDVVIHLAEFIARGTGAATEARISFALPVGVTSITAYSYCNLHDCWRAVSSAV